MIYGVEQQHINALEKAVKNNKGRLRTIFVDPTHIEMIDAYLQTLADHDPNFSYQNISLFNTLRLRECMNLAANFLHRKWKKFANEKGEFGLHAEYLKKVVGNDYSEINDHLQAAGIITISKDYISPVEAAAKGIKTKCKTVRFLVSPGKRLKPIELNYSRKLREAERNPHSNTQLVGNQVFHNTSIGLTRLLEMASTFDIDDLDLINLFELENKIDEKGCMTLEITRDMCGREYYDGLSNLKKELRSCILVNGQPMLELDMPSSHPNWLAFTLNNYKTLIAESWFEKIIQKDRKKWIFDKPGIAKDELKKFTKLVVSQKFYDRIAKETNQTREAVKTGIQKVFNSPYYKDTPVANWFQKNFPTLYAFIKKVNGKDTKPLAHILMSVESQLLIKGVRDKLDQHSATVSMHDGYLITTEDQMELAQETLKKLLIQYGCNPEDVPAFKLKATSTAPERADQKQVVSEIIERVRVNTEVKMNVQYLMKEFDNKYFQEYYKTVRFCAYTEKGLIRAAKQLKRIITKEAAVGNTEPAEWVDEIAMYFFDNQPPKIRVPLKTENLRLIVADKVFRSGPLSDWPTIIGHLNKNRNDVRAVI